MTNSSSTHPQEPVLIIEPGRTEKNYWADLWRYRELFLTLAWRDISVRYKQTIIGILWAIIRPFLTIGRLHRPFWPHRQTPQRRQRPLRPDGLCRHAPLVSFLKRPE